MSLLDTAERFASIDRSQIVLDSKRCLHALDKHSNCGACYDICPANAITPGKPPVLVAEACQGCRACLPVCPVGAYRADDDVALLLNCVTHLEGKSVELVCGVHPQPETGVQPDCVGVRIGACLAGLGTGAYLSLAALGLEQVFLRTDACGACKWAALEEQVDQHAEHANRILSAWEKIDTVVVLQQIDNLVERPLWDVKNPPLSRRDLFRMLGRQGQVAVARAMENGLTTSKRQPGRDRMRLLSALSHLPDYSPGGSVNLDGFNFATLEITAACTACGACGNACPTEALRFEKNQQESEFKLTFSPQNCIGCDLCAQVCAPAALTLEHAPSFESVFGKKDPAVAAAGELVRCERCKSLMAARPGVRMCALCEYRRSHPFGSIMPAELKSQIERAAKELHS